MERKMAFYEIGRGQLARDMQEAFERAQKIAVEREIDVNISLKITVHKPDPNEEDYIRSVSYSHELKQPPMKSLKYNAVQKDNVIIRDAEQSPEQLSMLDLDIKKPNAVEFRQGKAANGKE